jgi:hypothetical protein
VLSQMFFSLGNATPGNAVVDYLFSEPLHQGIDLYLSVAVPLNKVAAAASTRSWQLDSGPYLTQQTGKRVGLPTGKPLNRIDQDGGNI